MSKCEKCGLTSPTVRKVLSRIVSIGNQLDIVYVLLCTACVPYIRYYNVKL